MAEPWIEPAGPAEQRRVMAELENLVGFHISLANTAIKAHHFFPVPYFFQHK